MTFVSKESIEGTDEWLKKKRVEEFLNEFSECDAMNKAHDKVTGITLNTYSNGLTEIEVELSEEDNKEYKALKDELLVKAKELSLMEKFIECNQEQYNEWLKQYQRNR